MGRGIPHYTQTAFHKGISCADPTEVIQEAVRDYVEDGSVVYQCLYDLEKAFDSVEICVLLRHLFGGEHSGIYIATPLTSCTAPSTNIIINCLLNGSDSIQCGHAGRRYLSPSLIFFRVREKYGWLARLVKTIHDAVASDTTESETLNLHITQFCLPDSVQLVKVHI